MTDFGSSEYICPRLLDYFIVVGPDKNADENSYLYKSKILKRFPPTEHEDFSLPVETVYFCQPDPINRDDVQRFLSSGVSSFLFTLTDKDKNRIRYGVCMNFACNLKSLQNGSDASRMSLISFCIITHHPMFSGFRRFLNTLKEMIDCLPGFGKMITGQKWNLGLFWNLFLYGDDCDQSLSNGEALSAIQIEKWILRFLSTPAPVPSCTFIRLKLLPEEVEPPLTFALPDKNRLSLVDFSFYLPMELLGIQNCLKVILAVLLEQKVLLKSRDYNALTMCILALTKMLYPLQYMFPVIPLLPTSLPNAEQILLSPTPFIIGIPSSFLREKGQHVPMSEILLVDIDSGQLTYGDALPKLPDFPTQEKNNLCAQLMRALELMRKGTNLSPDAIVDLITRPQTSGTVNPSPTGETLSPVDVDVIDVATRVAMVRFLNSPGILADFTEHTRTLRLFPRPVVTFQYISFMRSRPTIYPFTQKLARTQAVEFLSEWCIYPENEVFQRIHAGIFDPKLIGDKPKWFCSELVPIDFRVYDDSDTCLIHLGCCKNRNPWAVENILIAPWLGEKMDYTILKREVGGLQLVDGKQGSASLVDYRIYFAEPPGVAEAVAFARAARDREASATAGARPPVAARAKSIAAASVAAAEEAPDDVRSSSGAGSGSSSDQDDFDIWDLKATESKASESKEGEAEMPSVETVPTNEMPRANGGVEYSLVESRLSGITKNGSFPWKAQISENQSRDASRGKPGKNEDEDSSENLDIGDHFLNNISSALSEAGNALSKFLIHPQSIIQKSKQFIQSPTLTRRKEPSSESTSVGGGSGNQAQKPGDAKRRLEKDSQGLKKALGRLTWVSFDEKSSEKQELLKGLTQAIWGGEKVGLRTKHEVQGLLEDERYRNYLLVKLLAESHEFHYEPLAHLPNVALQDTPMFRHLVWLAKAVIWGYERNWVERGIHGVGSAFLLLELAHTHFWDQSIALEHELRASKQRPSSLQGSRENLMSLKMDKNPLGSLSSLIKTTTATLRRSSLVGGSDAEGLPNLAFRRSSKDMQSEGSNISVSGSSTASPMRPRAKISVSVHSSPIRSGLFGREVITDTATEFKCKSSGMNRYSGEQLLRCVPPSQEDLQRQRHQPRYYVFEALIGPKERSRLWDQPQFWEDAFLDSVARERDLLGLDHSPTAMLERYAQLPLPERKLWDLKEDRILATELHNLIAFMVMLKTNKQEIYNVAYRLLGRCRLGSYFSHSISNLLECVAELTGNGIDLIPSMSDSIYREAFIITMPETLTKPCTTLIMEVYENSYVLRGLGGAVECVRSFKNLVAVVVFTKARTCLLIQNEAGRAVALQMNCKKTKAMLHTVKQTMKRLSFEITTVPNPLQFCRDTVTNHDGWLSDLESLGQAEGLAFSKPDDLTKLMEYDSNPEVFCSVSIKTTFADPSEIGWKKGRLISSTASTYSGLELY